MRLGALIAGVGAAQTYGLHSASGARPSALLADQYAAAAAAPARRVPDAQLLREGQAVLTAGAEARRGTAGAGPAAPARDSGIAEYERSMRDLAALQSEVAKQEAAMKDAQIKGMMELSAHHQRMYQRAREQMQIAAERARREQKTADTGPREVGSLYKMDPRLSEEQLGSIALLPGVQSAQAQLPPVPQMGLQAVAAQLPVERAGGAVSAPAFDIDAAEPRTQRLEAAQMAMLNACPVHDVQAFLHVYRAAIAEAVRAVSA